MQLKVKVCRLKLILSHNSSKYLPKYPGFIHVLSSFRTHQRLFYHQVPVVDEMFTLKGKKSLESAKPTSLNFTDV